MNRAETAHRLTFLLALALGAALLPAAPVTRLPTSTGPASRPVASLAPTATPLPGTRFEFGVTNGPGKIGWMTGAGVPWGYRYQYLSGGVNTNGGWETWNANGDFPLLYMNESTTPPANYVPVLTYYEICQSLPGRCPSGQDQASDYTNVNNTSTMASYFGNFVLLLQKAAVYGKKVVIHVEPDFWGMMQQKAAGAGPAGVSASVASSSYTCPAPLSGHCLSAFPNTVQGFAYALLYLRDQYAHNVVMATHASPWASNIDIGSDTNPGTNAATEADKTAAFLAAAGLTSNSPGIPPGISTWDVVFNDVADRDAGFYELQYGANHWWDRTNATLPNFNRYLQWVTELHLKTNRQQVVWQVPVGNQYYQTLDNSWGHYQDNRAEYFLGHVADLAAAGLVAVLFGGGAGGTTSYDDSRGDGVTNGPGHAITDLWGACSACNGHLSTVADDDGGYLRTFVGQYYQSPYPLTPPPPPPSGVYNPVVPFRILDIRFGPQYTTPLTHGATRTVQVAGFPGSNVPATGVLAAVLNVTAVNPTAASFLTVWPAGAPRPLASNLNWTAGSGPRANLVQVALGGGNVNIYSPAGLVDLVIDVAGYFNSNAGPDGLYQPLTPYRMLDTRASHETLGPTTTLTKVIAPSGGPGGIPASGVEAVVLNVTVANPQAASFLTIWPADAVRPTSSNLNWVAGQTVPNRVTVKLGSGGNVSFYNAAGLVDVIVDVSGYYTDTHNVSGGFRYFPLAPYRVHDTRSGPPLGQGQTESVNLVGTIPNTAGGAVLNVTVTNTSAASFLSVWPQGQSRPLISDLNWVPGDTVANLVPIAIGSLGHVDDYNPNGSTDVVMDVNGYYG
jgi:hypothetical protein